MSQFITIFTSQWVTKQVWSQSLPFRLLWVNNCNKKVKAKIALNTSNYESLSTRLCKSKEPSKMIYKILVIPKSTVPFKSQNKWLQDLDLHNMQNPEISWEDAYSMPFQTTKSTKLREFLYNFNIKDLQLTLLFKSWS